MNTDGIFTDKDFQTGFESFIEDLARNINEMSDDERLIYKADISLTSLRSGNGIAVNDIRDALVTLRTRMSDYRFNKVLEKLRLSKKVAIKLMNIAEAV